MVITSRNEPKVLIHFRSTHFRYAMTYVIITFVVLLFLNIYSSNISRALIYNSKEASLEEKCQLAAAKIADLEVINSKTVADAVSEIDSLRVTRLIITNRYGLSIYDSASPAMSSGRYILFPEIVQALKLNNVFTCNYNNGSLQSNAATPIVSYGMLIGCVYITEYDISQGSLLRSLQNNILMITIVLEVAVIIFSLSFSAAFTTRLRRIMTSMRIIRSGDYSHKVEMGGNDELTVLGNEFNNLVAKLRVSEDKRRQFVSDASHELKTPLASIKLLTDSILQNPMDAETIHEFVRDIGNEADRLNRMSMKLLSLSKIDSQVDNSCEIIDIAPTARRVIRMLSAIAQEYNITIESDLAENCPVLILEDDLYQIIFNLVENGIKYNLPGGDLRVTVYRQADDAILKVIDSGVGIPEASISQIFERFYRVDKARARKSGGSGLGLSIVHSIVERNRGEISVESTVGQGTTFTVTFPIFDTEEDSL